MRPMPDDAEQRVTFASPGHYTDKDREKIPASHFAGPNKSYPIEVPQDVEDAARLVGHADDPEAVKARIKSIAHELGAAFVAKLPKEWTEGEGAQDESERAILSAHVTRSAARAAEVAPNATESEDAVDDPQMDAAARIFAPITRIDTAKREIIVTATSEAVDSFNTRFGYEASKDAFMRWYGNVREMHQPKAVGQRIEILPDDEARRIQVRLRISRGAEDTWQKVLDGTLAGASIGANNVVWERPEPRTAGERAVPVATKYDLVELSLVDNPSNPDARGIQIARSDASGVAQPDPEILDALEEAAAPTETPAETPAEPEAAETVSEPASEPVTSAPERAEAAPETQRAGVPSPAVSPRWNPGLEDYASFIARERRAAATAELTARGILSDEPVATAEPPVAQARSAEASSAAPAEPPANVPMNVPIMAQGQMIQVPDRYPAHIRAAAIAAGEHAYQQMPSYQAALHGPNVALWVAQAARARGEAEFAVYRAYAEGERVATELAAQERAEQAAAEAERATATPAGKQKTAPMDEKTAPAAQQQAAAQAVAKQQVKQAQADQEDAGSIPDDNSAAGNDHDADDEENDEDARLDTPSLTREATGITTSAGLQGYELNGSPTAAPANRHRHSHGGDSAQIHTHQHEHTHANGLTHAHPHAHGHAERFDGGEHSHMHSHQHSFRNGEATDLRLAQLVAPVDAAETAETQRGDSLSQTGLKSNVGIGKKAAGAGKAASGAVSKTKDVGKSIDQSHAAGDVSSPILNITPQKVGSLSVVDTEEPMAQDGGVPDAAHPEPTPATIQLDGEQFHEGGHPTFSDAGNELDIDGDHDEGDPDEDEPETTEGALQHAQPSAITGGRPTPKNGGSPARTDIAPEEERMEERAGARISGASRDRLHRMRDNHRSGMLDAADLCNCPECRGLLAVINGGMLDTGADADHASGADETPTSAGGDTAILGSARALLAQVARLLTQSQAEHLDAQRAQLADALGALTQRMQDLEASLLDATSQLGATVETSLDDLTERQSATRAVAAPEDTRAALASQVTSQFTALSESVTTRMESQLQAMEQRIIERVNAVASVAEGLEDHVERIAAQPATTGVVPLPQGMVAEKVLSYQQPSGLQNRSVGGPTPRELAIRELQAQREQVLGNPQAQMALAQAIMQLERGQ